MIIYGQKEEKSQKEEKKMIFKSGIVIFFIFFILLLVNFTDAASERVTLDIGSSYLIEGKNVTLVGSNKDSILLCINNIKGIVSENKIINGVSIDLKKSDDEEATMRLIYTCEDCVCDALCSNTKCVELKVGEGIECNLDIDCDDGDLDTFDMCEDNECVYEVKEMDNKRVIEGNRTEQNVTFVKGEDEKEFGFSLFTIIIIGVIIVLLVFYFVSGPRDKS